MNYKVLMESIVGYKNKIKNNKSQDYAKYEIVGDNIIAAVADGHSTSYFQYSDFGAKFACESAIEILKLYIENDNAQQDLDNKVIQRLIYDLWNKKVDNHYKSIKPVVYKTEYLKYSSTLIATLITKDYTISIQIGDGDIIKRRDDLYDTVISNVEKIKPVDSLGRLNMYNRMYYNFEKNKDINNKEWMILYTDGYENAFDNKELMFASIDKTIKKYSKNVFTRLVIEKKYSNYLNKLSKEKSLDDISIIIIQINQ